MQTFCGSLPPSSLDDHFKLVNWLWHSYLSIVKFKIIIIRYCRVPANPRSWCRINSTFFSTWMFFSFINLCIEINFWYFISCIPEIDFNFWIYQQLRILIYSSRVFGLFHQTSTRLENVVQATMVQFLFRLHSFVLVGYFTSDLEIGGLGRTKRPLINQFILASFSNVCINNLFKEVFYIESKPKSSHKKLLFKGGKY